MRARLILLATLPVAFAAAAPAAAIAGPAAAAQARRLTIQRFHADVTVRPDASLGVVEHLSARFEGSWNGLYRDIPLTFPIGDGRTRRLRITAVGATGADGSPLRLESRIESGELRLKIWVPGARDAVRQVVLHYRVQGALRFFQDHDEVYWNATGNAWTVPIESASATVHLPAGAAGVRTAVYTGPAGARTGAASVTTDSAGAVTYTAQAALAPGSGLTVVAGWNPGLVARPTAAARTLARIARVWPLALPVLAFVGLFALWWRMGRDPEEGPLVVRYEPPDGLGPAETGYVATDGQNPKGITATIVDLAVRGLLRIEEEEKHGFLEKLNGTPSYVFVRTSEPSSWSGLKAFEAEILEGLFDGGASERTPMQDLRRKFYRNASRARRLVGSEIMADRFYGHSPSRVRGSFTAAGVLLGALLLFVVVASNDHPASAPFWLLASPVWLWLIAVLGVVVSFLFWGYLMPARTSRGAAAHAAALGFKEFLSRVDADRYDRTALRPELFDRFLPYAMAFGVEKKWAERFEGMTLPPPTWYAGPYGVTPGGGFSPTSFVSAFSSGMTSAAGAMGAGGSGLGGGGASGGGAGGGGGGGF